jgi:hypothetical protein
VSGPIRWAEMNCPYLFQNCMFYITRNDPYGLEALSSSSEESLEMRPGMKYGDRDRCDGPANSTSVSRFRPVKLFEVRSDQTNEIFCQFCSRHRTLFVAQHVQFCATNGPSAVFRSTSGLPVKRDESRSLPIYRLSKCDPPVPRVERKVD